MILFMYDFYRSNLLLSQSEVTNVRTEKERVKAEGLKSVETLEQRLQQVEIMNEVTKREHHSVVTQLHSDSQLLATLHRVILFPQLITTRFQYFYLLN